VKMEIVGDDYEQFLATKQRIFSPSGFDAAELNKNLKPFQDFIVRRSLKHGRYAVFADCGLGKSFMQLEFAYRCTIETGKRALILAPLAVVDQTIEEAQKFRVPLDMIDITNYEQLDNLDLSVYACIVLDESSILKNFDGAMRNKLIEVFAQTPYKLCCTATPSPNDPIELGEHAEFLGVMKSKEMLAMYFVHDSGSTQDWRLKGHAVKAFYEWVSTWAIMLTKPQDIGFEEPGYVLPKLNLIEHKIETDKFDNGELFNSHAVNATGFNAELRRTIEKRLDVAAGLIDQSQGPWVVIVNQDAEADYVVPRIPNAIEVRGSEKPETKKAKLLGFAHDKYPVMVTKAKIVKFGMNYQNCHNAVVGSLDFSFESLYQFIRRFWRFGQEHEVNIHIITTDTMQNVIDTFWEKQRKFTEMQKAMAEAMNTNLSDNFTESRVYDADDVKTDDYHIRRGDCVRLIRDVPIDSIGLSVFSPPFAQLYTYSSHVEDMGNSTDHDQFMMQFNFLVSELFRVMKPGRNVAVHCMDLPIQKGKEGFIGLRDFSGMILRAFESAGFIYHSRITIWKDPVTEMQRTKALGLLHKQVKKDSTMSRVGIPDYVLVFRKDGERVDPVANETMSVDMWQKIASPVWFDIDQGDTLSFRMAREEEDEKHICPLQLGVIERLIHLYSNPGDTVFTPFMGIGSEIYQAVKFGRRGIGFELKESYYAQAKSNLAVLDVEKGQKELF
jgi:hypothetical protein